MVMKKLEQNEEKIEVQEKVTDNITINLQLGGNESNLAVLGNNIGFAKIITLKNCKQLLPLMD